MGKKFDLAEILAGKNPGGNVSDPDTGQDQLRYIPYPNLIPDKSNGYSMSGVEELARNIEIVGLQQPLRVLASEDKADSYQIISGHRRHAAIGLLIDQGSELFAKGVPCIVDSAAASAALRELQLLLGNADNRKLTSADEAQQAERISDCLRKLEDEGYSFPGRHRDWVAKLSGMSRTKLARLAAIKKNLLPTLYRDFYKKGKLSESVAYALAKQDPETQQQIVDFYSKHDKKVEQLYAHNIDEYVELRKKFAELKCKKSSSGPCINQERLLEKCLSKSWAYSPCRHASCCATCSEITNCKYHCQLMDEKAREERNKKREESKAQKAEASVRRDAAVRNIEHVWFRFGQALTAAGLTDKQLRKQLKTGETSYNEFETYVTKEKTAALLDYSCTETKESDPMPFFYGFHASDYRRLCAIADALGCSLDYLFCRSEDPQPAAAPKKAEVSVRHQGWLIGTAPGGVKCWARFMDEETSEDYTMMATYDADADAWYCGDSLSQMSVIDQRCIGWWPLPDDNAPDLPAALTPEAVSGTDTEPEWRTGTPEMAGTYWCEIQCGQEIKRQPARWLEDQWHFYNLDESFSAPVLRWYPLPEEG